MVTLLCAVHTPARERSVRRLGVAVHTRACPGCGRKVILGPSSVDLVVAGVVVPSCEDCYDPKPVTVVLTTEAGERELSQIRRTAAEMN